MLRSNESLKEKPCSLSQEKVGANEGGMGNVETVEGEGEVSSDEGLRKGDSLIAVKRVKAVKSLKHWSIASFRVGH